MSWIGIWSLSGIRSKMAVIEKEDNTGKISARYGNEKYSISLFNLLHWFSRSSVCHAVARIHPAGRFSLYGVRHMTELSSSAICKQACVTSITILTALFFRSRPSAMQQLESTAAQLLLAVWRAPYSRITASCHLQVNLRDVYHNSYRIVFSKPSVCHVAARIHCCAVASRCMASAI